MKDSGIQWTTHTFNPWRGCTKVSAGCANCYAETLSKRNPRTLGTWGPNGTRIVAAEARWKEVLDWNAAALEDFENWTFAVQSARSEYDAVEPYERPRVFCASLADVFENWKGPMHAPGKAEVILGNDYRASAGDNRLTLADVRDRLFDLIKQTPALDWLLLTKRPERMAEFVRLATDHIAGCAAGGHFPTDFPNVWLGTTVENRDSLPRIDVLRNTPAAVRFLSCEPLLEDLGTLDLTGIHWVIVGGESGHGSRPFRLEWARSIVGQCRAANVAVFMKQFGAHPIYTEHANTASGTRGQVLGLKLLDRKKGGDIEEWPADLQVREFPEGVRA